MESETASDKRTSPSSDKSEIDELTAELERVRREIRAKSPRHAAIAFPNPFTLKDMQSDVLDDETLLLE